MEAVVEQRERLIAAVVAEAASGSSNSFAQCDQLLHTVGKPVEGLSYGTNDRPVLYDYT